MAGPRNDTISGLTGRERESILGVLEGGCVFFWYRDVFFVASRWPKSPFWYRDLYFGIEILYSVVQHLYRPLLGINPSVLFWASTSCKVEVKVLDDLDTEKKIEKYRYLKKTSRYQLKESPAGRVV